MRRPVGYPRRPQILHLLSLPITPMQASSGQSRRLGSKVSSAADAVADPASSSLSLGNPGRVPKPSRDGAPPAEPAGSPRDSGSGVGKAGVPSAGVAPVRSGSSEPQILHFPSWPMRPTQDPSGQSRRWLGSRAVLSSCFVDMMRERLIESSPTPRHIVAPLRCPQFPMPPADLVPTEVATSPKP